MRTDRREALLKIAVGVVVGLFVIDRAILSPALSRWKRQGERIAALEEKVKRGRQLIDRESSLRGRWEEMLRTDLADDLSTAESDVFKAVARWSLESRVGFNSMTPQWRPRDEGSEKLEFRATATGDQASLGRLIYEIETDALPVRVEECELTARDAKGKQLTLAMRFSFIRLIAAGGSAR